MEKKVALVAVLCLFLFLTTVVECGKKEMGCVPGDKYTGKVTTEEFASAPNGYNFSCQQDTVLTSLNVMGHKGSCKGLPPDIYVKSLSCHWKSECTLEYKSHAIMRVFNTSNVAACIQTVPDYFTFNYECTENKNVKVLNVTGYGHQEEKIVQGILRSHGYHPWLYKKHEESSLTLIRPKKKPSFVFKLRSLNLWQGDNLTVTWTHDKGEEKTKTYTSGSNTDGGVLDNVKKVKFTLNASPNTLGGDGFTMCFKWDSAKNAENKQDPCKKVIKPRKICEEKRPSS